jgi:hypothetical protein
MHVDFYHSKRDNFHGLINDFLRYTFHEGLGFPAEDLS